MVGFCKENYMDVVVGRYPPSSDEHSWVKTIENGYGSKHTKGSSDQVVKGVQYVVLELPTPAWECIEGASNVPSESQHAKNEFLHITEQEQNTNPT